MQGLAIVLLYILAAITYGIIHDQITARICVEYFTIGHPPVFLTLDPTLLGLGWGIIATWWVGLLLGIPTAPFARLGDRPKRSAASLIRPLAKLLLIMGACAAVAGFLGWIAARNGLVQLIYPLSVYVAPEKHPAFIADLWSHLASYLVGFIGGIVVIAQVWRSRKNLTDSNNSLA